MSLEVQVTKLVLIAGPSGVGKNAIVSGLIKILSDLKTGRVVTYTTRPARFNEIDGVDYFFVSKEEFDSLYIEGFFLEKSFYAGYLYGTPKNVFQKKMDILFCILDEVGVEYFKRLFPSSIAIWITAENCEDINSRILSRKDNSHLFGRLIYDSLNLCAKKSSNFDFIVKNKNFEECLFEIKNLICT